MSFSERAARFTEFLVERYDMRGVRSVSQSFGVSNGARVIEGGLQLGISNLDRYSSARRPRFVVGAQIRFPPGDEVWFSVTISPADVVAMEARLAAMKAAGTALPAAAAVSTTTDAEGADAEELPLEAAEPGNATATAPSEGGGTTAEVSAAAGALLPPYSARNHLTRLYLTGQGLHLHNNTYFDSLLEADPAALGPAIPVGEVVYSVWPPAERTRRSLLTQEFVGYLGELVGRTRLHEVHVWPDEAALSPAMLRMPATIPVGEIVAAVQAMGGHYPNGEVEQLHAALNFLPDKHFVVLPGLSGTGKTRIAMLYARAVHGLDRADAPDPLLFTVPIRPEWTDPSGLTGYFDVLTGRYVVPPFLEALMKAEAHSSAPVFVILDEMNLARVEYYFADVLSAIESGEPLHLHSSDAPLEGSNGASVPRAIPVPSNLFIVGTINIDETTSALSDKVLDRAMLVPMTNVDLPGFLDGLAARESALAGSVAACRGLLVDVHSMMAQAGQGFGYRVAEEAVRYHAFASGTLGTDHDAILDRLLRQKVLVKLRGAERERALLDRLAATVAHLPHSSALLARLAEELAEFGSFQASR